MSMTVVTRANDDLLALADDAAEHAFAREAIAFLSARVPRRAPERLRWGDGSEGLTIFHETAGDEERIEAEAAKAWQATRWDAGFGWLTGPVEYGGRALPVEFDRLYRAIEAEFDVPDLNPIRIGLSTVGPSLLLNGTDEQVRRYAVAFQRGDAVACQLFSEPDAGSDLANVKTRGVRDGDGWLVTGQKVWTSNAQFADVGLALVRTDPSAPKHRGLTMFLVRMDSPGVEIRPLRQLTGGASFTEVFLDHVFVPDELRVGDVGEGWRVAVSTLTGERTSTGDRSHGMTKRAAQLLCAMAARTGANREPRHRQAVADVLVRLEVARCYQRRLQSIPAHELRGPERAVDKLLLSDNVRRIGETAAHILGPALTADTGEWGTFAWNRWILGALGYRLGGGTDEILKTMIAERLLGLPREPS
jgi:alkylation response protein AidB-like acyl-CoA dehydrogenase